MSNLTSKQGDSAKTTPGPPRKSPLSLAERLAIPAASTTGATSADKGLRSPGASARTPERPKGRSPKRYDAPALPTTSAKKRPPPPLNSTTASRSVARPSKLTPVLPTTPRSLAVPTPQPTLTAPSPTSASSSQFRTKRGGGNSKRQRNKDTPTILVDNPKPQSIEDAIASMTISKPQSIEDAIAQMTSNPFGGRPPKSPLLHPQPRVQNSLPPPSPGSTAKTLPADPVPEQDGKSQEQQTTTLEEDADDTHAQYLTLSVAPSVPATSRPHTPSVHIDWAGDDDDDGSLPDLDDWVTQSSIAPISKAESTGKKEHCQPNSDAGGTQTQQHENLQPDKSILAGREEDKSQHETPSAVNVKNESMEVKEDETAGQQSLSLDGQHPVEGDSTGAVRVFLPASRSRLFNRQLAAVAPPTSDSNLVADNKLSDSDEHPRPQLQTPTPHSIRPSPSVSSLEVRDRVDVSPERRPASVSSSPVPPLKAQHYNNGWHARTRSLPQAGRGLSNHPRGHMHATRPIISPAGLSRISRTLAASGFVTPPASKIKDASPLAVE